MCVIRFEERPKKFNEGSAVRLIDALRKQRTDHIDTEKPAGGNVVAGQNKRNTHKKIAGRWPAFLSSRFQFVGDSVEKGCLAYPKVSTFAFL